MAKYIKTHHGTRTQREWQSREEVEAAALETLRSWLKQNDPNGDYDDDPDPDFGIELDHEFAVEMVCQQSELEA